MKLLLKEQNHIFLQKQTDRIQDLIYYFISFFSDPDVSLTPAGDLHQIRKWIFKLYSCTKSHLSLYDCITVWWKSNQSNLTNRDKGPLMAIRFFRTAAQPCIKEWGEQACNLINALKMVKMDNERAKSQMARSVCLLGTLTAYWSAKESLGQGHGSDTASGTGTGEQ